LTQPCEDAKMICVLEQEVTPEYLSRNDAREHIYLI